MRDHCRFFQVEVVAIQVAAKIIEDGKVSKWHVTILSDSEAAFRALSSNVMNSNDGVRLSQIPQQDSGMM